MRYHPGVSYAFEMCVNAAGEMQIGGGTMRNDAPSLLQADFLAGEQEELLERLSNLNLNFNVLLLAIYDLLLDAPFLPRCRMHHRVGHEIVVRPRTG